MPDDECWVMDSEEITELKEKEILIKAEYLSIDPYMRGKMNDTISYTPPLKIGEVMVGESVGRVIESKIKKICSRRFSNSTPGLANLYKN